MTEAQSMAWSISRPPLGEGLRLVHSDVEMRLREDLAAVPATDGWITSARWTGKRGCRRVGRQGGRATPVAGGAGCDGSAASGRPGIRRNRQGPARQHTVEERRRLSVNCGNDEGPAPAARTEPSTHVSRSDQPDDRLRRHGPVGGPQRGGQCQVKVANRTRLELTCLGCLVGARLDASDQVQSALRLDAGPRARPCLKSRSRAGFGSVSVPEVRRGLR